MSKNECRFYPVQCLDETFQTLSPQEGYVYFVTDKKKIYLGKNSEMIPMCSTSGFFYGIKEIEYDNSGIAPDPNVVFYFNEIEGNDIPEEDDLILNVDGCFYRVKTVAEDGLETVRLTLQGTGVGGGGGGTGGGGTGTGSFSISVIDGKAKTYASTATIMEIKFKGNYNGTDDNVIAGVAFKRKGDENPFYSVDKIMPFNQEQTVDIFPYKHLFNTNKTTVTMYVYDLYGTERSTNITVQIVDLELKKTKSDLLSSFANNYTYSCQLIGATSGVEDKKIIYSLYQEDNLYAPVVKWEKNLTVTDEDEIQYEFNLSSLPHDVYVLKVQASARISGTTTTLTSNVLTHKLARFAPGSSDPLLMVMFPDVTEQHTNIPVQYMVLAQESNKDYTLNLSLDGVTKIQLTVQSNKEGEYNLYFEEKGTYTLSATVIELNLVYTTYIVIVPYTGNLPVIDPTRSDLMLYLNPRNKSNSALDRGEWADYNGNYTGTLTGLHYGIANGWLMDDDGVNYLKLTSGATFSMPDFRPFLKDPTKFDGTDGRMGSGMTIELDFEINGVLDYDTELIKCLSRNKDGDIKVGFCVTGDRVRFYSSRGALLSLNLVEGKRTRVSFVIEPNTGTINFPMVYGYLNGKLSGAVIYDSASDAFKDVSDGPAYLTMDSKDAQIKVYGVRVYSTALGDRLILNNYTASLATLEERQNAYDTNNVYDASGKIDYVKVSAEDYNLQVPYMKITGGWATEKESKWQLKDVTNANVGLPTGKKDYRMIDVEVKYPKNDYFANYTDYSFVNKFKSGKPMAEAYGEKPSNGGAIMYAQGTSSMEYPVKNLRLRFKNEENWYRVRPDIAKVEIICMKADYMESSGSHNTGAANLVDALYLGAGMKTPGQAHFGPNPEHPDRETIVTCIKGHPCLIFYSPSGEEGTYQYIGKYNLNLDKATPEPFGFDHDDDEFGYLKPGDEYYDIDYDAEGEYDDTREGEELKEVGEEDKINSIHCFEFLDNAVEVCNFANKYKAWIDDPDNPGTLIPDPSGGTYTYEETWYNTFKNKDNDDVPGWTLGFESRYPEDKVGYHDADSLYPLASWLNELHALRATDEALAIARFRNEYQCYLNKEFLLTYYLLTEALLMADSRVKNMMIATWGKENYGLDKEKYSYYPLISDGEGGYIPDRSQAPIKTNNYIFYPIFYDMDTMLGLDNTGVYRFNYYDEDTNSSVFNGDEVLWMLVRDALQDELKPWYSELEGVLLYASKDKDTGKDLGILPYFNSNQANMANEAFYNGDSKYKYIDPARNGYHDDLYDKDIAPGVGPYLYAAQGDRSLMREWFVTNRIKFLRGKYNSTHFKNGDRIEYRWYYPSGNEDEFKNAADGQDHSASITAVPPGDTFTFKSLKTGYAGVQVGANASEVHVERFDGEQTKDIKVPEAQKANGTEAYLLGLSNLSDLGDLSNKYMQKFIVSSSDVRLKSLTLGNPHRDYYNPYWGTAVEGVSPKIDLSGGTYLENFNLQNCSAYKNALDFSSCPAIQKILLTGSGVNALTLPVGGMITELRLPTSITALTIDSHEGLTKDNFSLGGYTYDEATPEIGKGNGAYTNDYSKLTSLKVINTPIDTYAIVKSAGNLEEYCLRNINWEITDVDTQYCIRYKNADLTPEQIRSYYTYNSTTKQYEIWGQDTYPTTEGVYLYERFDMVKDGKIVCIPVLEYLMSKSLIDSTKHAEALTGTIKINVAKADGGKYQVNELELYRRYIDTYPDVALTYGANVEVEGAHRVNFYYVDIDNIVPETGVTGLSPYFSVLTAGDESLATITAKDGFNTPNKGSTATETFRFLGIWTDVNTGNKYYHDDQYPAGLEDATAFSAAFPSDDMDLVPHFEASARSYTISFYDYTYPSESSFLFQLVGTYEAPVSAAYAGGEMEAKMKYQYRPDDNTLDEHERYVLKGWINETDFNNNTPNPELYDFENMVFTNDLKVFAFYGVENAQAVATDSKFFDIIPNTTVAVGDVYVTGSIINLKVDYAAIIGGKITLPSVDNEGNPITMIGAFHRNARITDLYFLPSAQYTCVTNNAFEQMQELRKVYLPTSVTKIGSDAFANSIKLDTVTLSDNITEIGDQAFYIFGGAGEALGLQVNALPSALTYLGDRAFCNAGKRITIQDLPASLTRIGTQCFMGCSNIAINYFGGEGSALTSIGYQAFRAAATNATNITEITINKGVALELGNNDTAYNTFGMGYPNVSKLTIGFKHKYEADTAALINDLFEEVRTVEVHTLE